MLKTMRPLNSSKDMDAECELFEWMNILALQWEVNGLHEPKRNAAADVANNNGFFFMLFTYLSICLGYCFFGESLFPE